MDRQKAKGKEQKAKGRRSPYANLPYDGRLLVRFMELLCQDEIKYTQGGRFTSRIHKAIMRVIAPGSEDAIKFSGFPGIWFVKSQSRPALNRWYIVDIQELTCEVDTTQLEIPSWMKIDPDQFYCEDRRHNGGICWHILCGALAEAARIDFKEFPEVEHGKLQEA